jgi:ribulose bisphosphate carboxylase small subunit
VIFMAHTPAWQSWNNIILQSWKDVCMKIENCRNKFSGIKANSFPFCFFH